MHAGKNKITSTYNHEYTLRVIKKFKVGYIKQVISLSRDVYNVKKVLVSVTYNLCQLGLPPHVFLF